MKNWQNSPETKSSSKRLNWSNKVYLGAKFALISLKKANTETQEIAKKYGRHILAGDSKEALRLLRNSVLKMS